MNLACPHCLRVIEFSADAPVFCGFCGQSLAGAVEVATADFTPAAESFANAATLPPDPTRAASDVPADAPGRIVAGYRLERELGRGGMGVVWEAEQIGSGRRVALKLLVSGRDHAPEALERFLREGQLAAALSHPRSTFVYEAGADQGQPYICMELMPGRTLGDICEEEGAVPFPRAVDLMLDVIEGLDAAHAIGVIHRDVKPSNCFLDRDGRIKVGDFGLSKSLESDAHLTRTGAFMGTPLFAAPEQVRGGAVDERTDIYAVGATLFYLIAHRGPFTGDATAVIAQIASDPAPSLRGLCPAVPKDLDRIVAQTLEKDSARRIPTLGALRLALQPFASAGLMPAPLGRRLGANLVDAILTGLVYFLVAIFIVFAVVASRGAEHFSEIPRSRVAIIEFGFFAVMVSYYSLLEGRTGRSLGKRLLGLRVVRADGSRPGLGRAALRALLVPGLMLLTTTALIPVMFPSGGVRPMASDPNQMLLQQVLGTLPYLSVVFCLVTMRQRNGYRGLHDLTTGTQVVTLRPAESGVRGLDPPVVKPIRLNDDGPHHYGPFQVRGVMGRCGDATVYAARDETLKRRVWVFVRSRDAGPIPVRRAHAARPTRPRWLQGGETGAHRWDAFEAVNGAPITELGEIKWDHGRFMLRDLADELAAAVADDTLPPRLALDQVWLDDEGRVKLLDAPLEDDGLADVRIADPSNAPAEAMDLLREAVDLCARGPSLPVFTFEFLAELKRRPNDLATLDWCAERLRAMAARPATVRWSDRLVAMGVSGGIEYSAYSVLLNLLALALLRLSGLSVAANVPFILMMAIILSFAIGFWTAGGPVFRLVGIAVRRADGRAASRLRCGVRNLVSWALPLIALVLNAAFLFILATSNPNAGPAAGRTGAVLTFDKSILLLSCGSTLLLLLHFVGMILAIVLPQRGPQDFVAGTRLVPK